MSGVPGGNNIAATNNGDRLSDSQLPSQYKVLTVTFNQDCTALAMGTMKAYSLFTIHQKTKVDQNSDYGVEPYPTTKYLPFEEVRIVERLFSSSLIALVTDRAPRKLNLIHFRKGSEISSMLFPTSILAIKLNRLILAVCMEESIALLDLHSTLKVLHTIADIPPNTNGLLALSPNSDNPYLAYPGSTISGEIHIFDTTRLKAGPMIRAHNGPIAAMSFDMSGTKIATASVTGTVIRVFNVLDGSNLFEFRRGVQRAAIIYSLAFSPDSTFLAVSSNTGTIHIFRLANPAGSSSETPATWADSIRGWIGSAVDTLPKQAAEVWSLDRSFATVHLTSSTLRTVIAMNTVNDKLVLFVAAYDGVISGYEVNTTTGGECKRISHYLLFDMTVTTGQETTGVNNLTQKRTDELAGNYPPNVFKNNDDTVSKSSA